MGEMLKTNDRPEELEVCSRILTRTKEEKLPWKYILGGQAWASINGIFFSIYFESVDITDSDRWRRFTVEKNLNHDSEIASTTNMNLIFSVANPDDSVGASLGIRIAGAKTTEVIDSLFRVLKERRTNSTFGEVFDALDGI